MALPVRDQAKYWGITAVLLLLVLWLMGDVILPFIVGGAIVYPMRPGSLFDPLTVRTCRFRVRNSQSLLTRTDIDDIGVRVRSRFAWSTLRLVTDEPQNSLLAS